MIVHKFRLYPDKIIEGRLFECLDLCRRTYNTLLGELQNQQVIDRAQIQGVIPDIKICDSDFNKVYSKTMQYECYKLFSNLKTLTQSKKIGRKIGKLRFKGKTWFKTFTYNQSGYKLVTTGKKCQTLQLSKIGNIPIRCHRNIKGKIKQITIKREPSNKWFAHICEETAKTEKKKITNKNKIVGIDVGLTNFIYDSDGNYTINPQYLKKHSIRIAHLQRKLSRKQKNGENRTKARIKLARAHEKLTNARNDFLHKLSRYYVNNYDVIGMEDLQISNMVHAGFSKSILDASWGKLRQYTSYKAENAGKTVITVNHKGTTQRCSKCGNYVKKELKDRTHNCKQCSFTVARDYNSALEIKRLTIKKIGREAPESTLAEMNAIPFSGQRSSMKQEVAIATNTTNI